MLNHKDIRIGDHVVLRGVTRHGKNRIHQHGDEWRVTNTESPTSFGHLGLESLKETFGGFKPPLNQQANKGLNVMWAHIKVKDSRWITFAGDKNFDITRHLRKGNTLWVE
jgi:hypothetical protein